MRITIALLGVWGVLAGPLLAQADLSAVIAQANAAYQNGDYRTAIRLYESVVAAGTHDGAIYYNLASAYERADDVGRALLNYRRAQNFLPRDGDLNAHIACIRAQRLDVQGDETGWLESLGVLTSNVFTLTELGWMIFALWAAWFALLSAAVLRRGWRDALRSLLVVCGILTLAGLLLLGCRLYVVYSLPSAVVVESSVQVMSGPGEHYLAFFQLHAAAEVRLLETDEEWVRFSLPDGRQGWMPRDAVEVV